MIKTRYLNDGTLIQHYSNKGYLLLQNETGIKYFNPIDAVPCRYTYTETDELNELYELSEIGEMEISDSQALDIITGALDIITGGDGNDEN